jgi:putative hydrolase of the HAD superfamily
LKFRAVVFDLFGTLTKNPSLQTSLSVIERMAEILSAPPEEFTRLWRDTFNERCDGTFTSIESNIAYVCRELGVTTNLDLIGRATRLRANMVRLELSPRPEATSVLTRLKEAGFGTALISDCSPPVPDFWPETPFAPYIDFPIFSCTTTIKKPDPRIYRLATAQLGVEATECLYVGDGSSRELTGASAVGMHSVLIKEADEDSTDVYRVNEETSQWQGPVIGSLTEILELVN